MKRTQLTKHTTEIYSPVLQELTEPEKFKQELSNGHNGKHLLNNSAVVEDQATQDEDVECDSLLVESRYPVRT